MSEGDRLEPAEWLYRGLIELHVDGDRILPDAIEVPACSFHRSSMGTPEGSLDGRPIEEVRVMEMQVSALPGPIRRDSDAAAFEFLAIHRPTAKHPPHSEVQLTPKGEPFREGIRKNKAFMLTAKLALADTIRVRPERYDRPMPGERGEKTA